MLREEEKKTDGCVKKKEREMKRKKKIEKI
jgi:hypothetical protein